EVKWINAELSRAFGGSFTIGTAIDNGFAFNARVVVVILIPGPILLEGKANIIKDRKDISSPTSDPPFSALAVLDRQAGTLLFDVDAHYVYPPGAKVLDIRGTAEGFFDFNHADRWYLNLGARDPHEKRITANLLDLFQANAYLMLSQQQ